VTKVGCVGRVVKPSGAEIHVLQGGFAAPQDEDF